VVDEHTKVVPTEGVILSREKKEGMPGLVDLEWWVKGVALRLVRTADVQEPKHVLKQGMRLVRRDVQFSLETINQIGELVPEHILFRKDMPGRGSLFGYTVSSLARRKLVNLLDGLHLGSFSAVRSFKRLLTRGTKNLDWLTVVL
jgi:hypothetical protein